MRAVRDGAGAWVLDGEKRYITNAGEAGLFVVFAVSDPAAQRGRVTAFLVPREHPGPHGRPPAATSWACRPPPPAT